MSRTRTHAADDETVVLVEAGVAEPRTLLDSLAPRAIIREASREPEARWVARLQRHFAELAASGSRIRTAVLVCADAEDNARLLMRAQTVCRLLKHMSNSSPVRLVLCTSGRQGPSVNGLLARSGALIESWVGAGVVVDVRHIEQIDQTTEPAAHGELVASSPASLLAPPLLAQQGSLGTDALATRPADSDAAAV